MENAPLSGTPKDLLLLQLQNATIPFARSPARACLSIDAEERDPGEIGRYITGKIRGYHRGI